MSTCLLSVRLALSFLFFNVTSNAFKTGSPAAKTGASTDGATKLDNDVYIADGDYIKDIDVNSLRNRYALTRGSTQRMVNKLLLSSC